MSALVVIVGMPMLTGEVMNSGPARASKPSLKISAALAPASLAFLYLWTKGHVPRCMSAMF